MKILCINQFFSPDLAPTGQLLTDVVRTLEAQGHQVTVICGSGIYAAVDHSRPLPSVKVRRISGLRFSRGRLGRILGYASFFVKALWLALLAERPDIVVSMTTPPLISIVGYLVSRLKASKHYIWEMDLYPEIAVDLGFIRNDSLTTKVIGRFADHPRRHAQAVIALGECMKDRLVARGLDPRQIHIAHNWADGEIFYPRHHSQPDPLVCIYAGNFGLGHDQDTIRAVVAQTQMSERINFRFVGGGARYQELQSFCKKANYGHVEFKPYCTPMELALNEFPASNLGLVLQGAECSGSVVPSKVYSLLASGLPLIFVGPRSATPAEIISRFNCGWQIDPGDASKLTTLLCSLINRPEEVRSAGIRAREAFLNHFDRPLGVARIISILGLGERQQA
jgi:glycosyltransferase involved in cell wall biosynthesis